MIFPSPLLLPQQLDEPLPPRAVNKEFFTPLVSVIVGLPERLKSATSPWAMELGVRMAFPAYTNIVVTRKQGRIVHKSGKLTDVDHARSLKLQTSKPGIADNFFWSISIKIRRYLFLKW